jgi:hypothetical protein
MKESEQKSGSGLARHAGTVLPGGGESHALNGRAAPDEQIRMRAYELYCERGGDVGDDTTDWLRAEREFLENASRTTADPARQGASASVASAMRG